VAVASAGPYANHLHFTPDRYTTLVPHSVSLKFLQAGCPSYRPTNSIKVLKAFLSHKTNRLNTVSQMIFILILNTV